MATLTRYKNFKSLKRNTPPKAKKVSNANAQQEIEIFFNLLKKKKHKSK